MTIFYSHSGRKWNGPIVTKQCELPVGQTEEVPTRLYMTTYVATEAKQTFKTQMLLYCPQYGATECKFLSMGFSGCMNVCSQNQEGGAGEVHHSPSVGERP